MYDIIYSSLCHQESEYILDFQKNVKKFNKNIKFLLVLHLNE